MKDELYRLADLTLVAPSRRDEFVALFEKLLGRSPAPVVVSTSQSGMPPFSPASIARAKEAMMDNLPGPGAIVRKISKRANELAARLGGVPALQPDSVPADKVDLVTFVRAIAGRPIGEVTQYLNNLTALEARDYATGFIYDHDALVRLIKDEDGDGTSASEVSWVEDTAKQIWTWLDDLNRSEEFRVQAFEINAEGGKSKKGENYAGANFKVKAERPTGGGS